MLCSSYSGNTEETLACFDAAEAVGAQRFAATTGGALAEAARARRRAGDRAAGGPAAARSVGYGFTVACEMAPWSAPRTGCGPRSTPPPRT